MPYYEYKCSDKNCNNETTVNCKMSEMKSEIECEVCGSIMKRKIENMVCGLSIDNTNSFYRKVN